MLTAYGRKSNKVTCYMMFAGIGKWWVSCLHLWDCERWRGEGGGASVCVCGGGGEGEEGGIKGHHETR